MISSHFLYPECILTFLCSQITWEFDPLGPNRVFTTSATGTANISTIFNNRETISSGNGTVSGTDSASGEADFSLLVTTYYGEVRYYVRLYSFRLLAK